MDILVYKNGKQVGPYTPDALRKLIKNGTLSPFDYCWHQGMSDWKPITQTIVIDNKWEWIHSKNFKIAAAVVLLVVIVVSIVAYQNANSPTNILVNKISDLDGYIFEFSRENDGETELVVLSDIAYDIRKTTSTINPYEADITGDLSYPETKTEPAAEISGHFAVSLFFNKGAWRVSTTGTGDSILRETEDTSPEWLRARATLKRISDAYLLRVAQQCIESKLEQ